MITVTRLNGRELAINADLIKHAESTPDTVITLTTGDVIIVKERLDELIRKVVEFKRSVARDGFAATEDRKG